MRRHHSGVRRQAWALQGWLQKTALGLMPRAFAVEQAFSEKLRGHIAAAAFLNG
jgi:hypothetical protein